MDKDKRRRSSIILGAAFLMATSAVGPGFLTQTTVFTKQLLASFGFVILVSVILDIFAQLNIWRALTVSGKYGQDVADQTLPGSGLVLSLLIASGGLVFNIGNIAGCGLGMNAITGLPVEVGAIVSAGIAIGIFLTKEAGRMLDRFVKVLGVVLLGMVGYVVFSSKPPLAEAALRTVWPETISAAAIVTLVGGTVGGYISFAGAHRLIDGGVTGRGSIKLVDRGAVTGIAVTAMLRFLLFFAAFGVVASGIVLDEANPPASVFQAAAGSFGMRVFGVVMWCAAITSVVGSAYTSVTFLKTLSPRIVDRDRVITVVFIIVSLAILLLIGRPVDLLIWAGTINGVILPFGLAIILTGIAKGVMPKDYHHPKWLTATGWMVVLIMGYFVISSIITKLTN